MGQTLLNPAKYLSFRRWLRGLLSGVIKGGATAGAALFGTAAANAVGMPISPMDWRHLVAVFAGGAVVAALNYLENEPIPQDDDLSPPAPAASAAPAPSQS